MLLTSYYAHRSSKQKGDISINKVFDYSYLPGAFSTTSKHRSINMGQCIKYNARILIDFFLNTEEAVYKNKNDFKSKR